MRVLLVLLLVIACAGVACAGVDTFVERYGPVAYVDSHGISVATNGFPVAPAAFETEVDATVASWRRALKAERLACAELSICLASTTVSWREYPFPDFRDSAPRAGLALLIEDDGRREIVLVVGYRDPLSDTALGHELGHAILWCCGLSSGESTLLRWADAHVVPF